MGVSIASRLWFARQEAGIKWRQLAFFDAPLGRALRRAFEPFLVISWHRARDSVSWATWERSPIWNPRSRIDCPSNRGCRSSSSKFDQPKLGPETRAQPLGLGRHFVFLARMLERKSMLEVPIRSRSGLRGHRLPLQESEPLQRSVVRVRALGRAPIFGRASSWFRMLGRPGATLIGRPPTKRAAPRDARGRPQDHRPAITRSPQGGVGAGLRRRGCDFQKHDAAALVRLGGALDTCSTNGRERPTVSSICCTHERKVRRRGGPEIALGWWVRKRPAQLRIQVAIVPTRGEFGWHLGSTSGRALRPEWFQSWPPVRLVGHHRVDAGGWHDRRRGAVQGVGAALHCWPISPPRSRRAQGRGRPRQAPEPRRGVSAR